MDKVLPVIEMPKPPPTAEVAPIPDSGVESDKELIKELLEDNIQENVYSDIIEVDEREIPEEEDVFDDPPPPKVKPILEEPEFSELPEKKTGKRKYTRKNPMSQKQKDHLARIRKIAQEKKLKEKELKQQRKEEEVERKLEEKILKKKREEQEKQNKPQSPPPYQATSQRAQGFTQEDLDNAVLNAVSTYDTYRKQQKKEKKERLQKDEEDRRMRDTIQRAIQPSQKTSDPWRSLFS